MNLALLEDDAVTLLLILPCLRQQDEHRKSVRLHQMVATRHKLGKFSTLVTMLVNSKTEPT